MSDTKAKRVERHYTTEDVEAALQLLCLRNGSSRDVERETGIPEPTIRYWRDKSYSERYQQIRADIFPKLHAKITAMWEDNARTAIDKSREAMEALDITQLKQNDLPKTVLALSTAAGIATDKSWNGRDKPSAITENRTAIEIMNSIARRNPGLIVDSTAEEDTDDQPALPPSQPAICAD